MSLTVIGDVHGEYYEYVDIARRYKHTLQLGDMGFDYNRLTRMCEIEGLSPDSHKFFGGNHDNYDCYYDCKHSLGEYGPESLGGIDFFFIRGGYSIDEKYRVSGSSWWIEEQLSLQQMSSCQLDYCNNTPNVVITHSCPSSIAKKIGKPGALLRYGFNPETFSTVTQQLLQSCFDIHQPKLWIFGHMHQSLDFEYMGTRFICLNELESFTIEENQV